MNKVIVIGNICKDLELRYSQGESQTAVLKFSIACQRKGKDAEADFINSIAFGKTAETIEKYFHKGSKIAIVGHIQTGSFTNKDGNKVYTTDVIVDEFDFVEKKGESSAPSPSGNNFMSIPDGDFDNLPFD